MNRNKNTEEIEVREIRVGQRRKVKQRDQLQPDPGKVCNKSYS